MPYPLEKLPYGLRRRLRELATLAEIYDFQVAAPDYYGLQPIQTVRPVVEARFLIDKKNNLRKFIDKRDFTLNSDEVPLYIAMKQLAFINITTSYTLSMFTDNYRLAPTRLYFSNCTLNTAFVKNLLSSLHSPVKLLDLHVFNTSKNAARAICNAPAFKGLEQFYVRESLCPSGTFWIEKFMEANCTSLKDMYMWNASLSTLQIDKEFFLNFVKAQSEGFQITIVMRKGTNLNRIVKLRNELLDEHFECVNLYEKKNVTICYGELEWYYILRAD